MSIMHDPVATPKGAFVFAQLDPISCSICAPSTMTQAGVERFACDEIGDVPGGWQAVDVKRIGARSSTPHECQHDPDRTHWFLLSGEVAQQLGKA